MLQLKLRRMYWASVSTGVGALLMVPGMQAQAGAADVTTLFQDARTVATQLRTDAMTMESYTRASVTWQSHSAQINRIKEHVNKAGSILSDMQAARGDAKPWHQEAIDEITPVLKELASNTTAIIDHLNSNPKHLMDPTYKEYLKDNADLATALSKAVGDTVDADNTRAKIGELQAKLGQ